MNERIGQRPSELSRVGFLSDEAEGVFYSAAKELPGLGVNLLTPAGVLYLLAKNEETSGVVELITGVPAEEIVAKAGRTVSAYKGSGKITIANDVGVLIDQAISDGGGVGKAHAEHLLSAMVNMAGADKTDAWVVFRDMNIDTKKVAEKARVRWFLKDITKELSASANPFIESESLKKGRIEILAFLNRSQESRVLVSGEVGSGRHTLLKGLAISMNRGDYPGLKMKRILEIDGSGIASLERSQKLRTMGESSRSFEDALFFVDLDKLSPTETETFLRLSWPVPILAISSPRLNTNEWNERWQVVRVSPSSAKEAEEIIRSHYQFSLERNQLTGVDQEKVIELLLRYGQAITQKAQPGAGVELLSLTLAETLLCKKTDLSPNGIAEIISRRGKIASEILLREMKERMLKAEEAFDKRVIGHEEAKKAVAAALRRRAAGLSNEKRPIGNFVFLGPTGVGKTELAKTLAEFLFGSEENMVRIDMSEYQEPHTVARLIGAPPGYVGYDRGGQLTEAVRRQPFSVILLDEIDKANLEVLNVFLQVFDDGRLTDGQGNTVDFSQTVIVMTSNHGSSLLYEALGRGTDLKKVRDNLSAWFKKSVRPEFLNRIDEVVVFDPLDKERCASILDLMLAKEVVKPMETNQGISVTIAPETKKLILELGFDPQLGARPLKRKVNSLVLDPLTKKVLQGEINQGDKLICEVVEGVIVIKKLELTEP